MIIEKFGHYEIKAKISEGKTATVFLAIDPIIDNQIAIKVFPRHFIQDPTTRYRFELESQIIASLDNPTVVPVYDVGEQNEHIYLVMPFMSGGSLRDRLNDDQLSLTEISNILTKLSHCLDIVHSTGISHQNIKPSNILFDQKFNPYLSDFGILKLAEPNQDLSRNIILGTPDYMSPEQVLGKPDINERSDIYSLGVVLFEMLTGVKPYQAVSPIKIAEKQILDPVPNIHDYRPDLPSGFEHVINRAMAKNPEDRFKRASELAEAFNNALVGRLDISDKETAEILPPDVQEEKSLPPASKSQPPPLPRRSRKIAWYLVILIWGVAVFASGGLLFGINSQRRPQEIAVQEFKTLTPSQTTQISISTKTHTEIPPTPTERKQTLPPAVSENSSPTPYITPSATPAHTLLPTSTPSQTLEPTPLVIGGADKIAFLNENDVWVANLDGSDLERLTVDGVSKSTLEWTPDGSALTFSSQDIVYLIEYPTGDLLTLGRFLDFEISPQMKSVVVGDYVEFPDQIKRWRNFILTYDPTAFHRVTLTASSSCPFEGGKYSKYSTDGNRLATIVETAQDGMRYEVVQVFELGDCNQEPDSLDMFPSQRFNMRGYSGVNDDPVIKEFAWDGDLLFALHGDIIDDFGDLIIYNMGNARSDVVNPINDLCCYRDIQWSPDGQYLLFAFHDIRFGGDTQLYIVPYGSIGTGQLYAPLLIPDYFFLNPETWIYPSLRPATEMRPLIPTATASPPTEASILTTTLQSDAPIIGGADKLAFVRDNEIWISNLDGSELIQITTDARVKSNLQWSPDGLEVIFQAGKCIYSIEYESGRKIALGCYSTFEISPDGQRVAISDDLLFSDGFTHPVAAIAPFHLSPLSRITSFNDLGLIGACSFLFETSLYRWSTDGLRMAGVIETSLRGRKTDAIQVRDVGKCGQETFLYDTFPQVKFEMRGYSGANDVPIIKDFAWDGGTLFALNGDVKLGFGELMIYDMSTSIGKAIDPLNQLCCYRDMRWSPDGEHILFAFLDAAERILLYYIPFNASDIDTEFSRIPLPVDFFNHPESRLYPALRPVIRPSSLAHSVTQDRTSPELINVEKIYSFQPSGQAVNSVAFSPDDQTLVTGSGIDVKFWAAEDGNLIHDFGQVIDKHTESVSSVAFSPDGDLVGSGSADDSVRMWRFTDFVPHINVPELDQPVLDISFSPDGNFIAAASADSTVKLIRTLNGGIRYILKGHTGPVSSVAFSPDGLVLASGSADHTVRFWQMNDGTELLTLNSHTAPVWSVAFSSDGQTLASASWDGSIKLWRVSDGTLLHTLSGHSKPVLTVAFSPDGKWLVSGSDDQTIRFWRVNDGMPLAVLQEHSKGILSVAVSADGSRVASASADGYVMMWQVEP